MKKNQKKSDVKKTDNIEIVVLLDRSGSMASIQTDIEGSLNNYVEEQKKNLPDAKFSFAKFDTEYTLELDGVPIKSVGKLGLYPRGMTALLDAIGKTIIDTKDRISKMKTKPKVLFVIITDGEENSSKEFKKEQIFDMIKTQKDEKWDFVFLGANQDAIQSGASIGINMGQTLTYQPTAKGTKNAFSSLCCYTRSFSGGEDASFTNDDRENQKG